MESFNKTKLSEDEIQRIVLQAFSQRLHASEELSDGWANTAYSITLQDGRRIVLKVAPTKDKRIMRCERDNMRTEVEALKLVSTIDDLPVPRVHMYDASCSIVPAEYFIMDYMTGTPYNKLKESMSAGNRASIERQLGEYTRRFNAIRNNRFGYFHADHGGTGNWRETFLGLIDDVMADGKDAGVELLVPYGEIEAAIERHAAALDDVRTASLVHWDLWDGNLFVEDGSITGIVDFERALWADPLIEYYFGRFASSNAYQEGYGWTITTESERQRRALYDFYLDLILAIECTYRQYTNKEHVTWANNNLMTGYERLLQL
jgi:aminoglycoside phosphotransferase (APT) family kinase protein